MSEHRDSTRHEVAEALEKQTEEQIVAEGLRHQDVDTSTPPSEQAQSAVEDEREETERKLVADGLRDQQVGE